MTIARGSVPVFLALCLLLGGASAAGYPANALLQIAAIGLIAASILNRNPAPIQGAARGLIVIMALWLSLIAAQLLPLPPTVWTALPGREAIADGFARLGLPLPWLPISLTPQQTISSLTWGLPAFSLLLFVVQRGVYKPALLAWVLVGISCASVILGALQLSVGSNSIWYLYEITNHGAMVGFFANSNHLSTLLLMTVPFLGVLVLIAIGKGGSGALFMPLIVVAMAMTIGGIIFNGSLAGIGLAIPVIGATGLLVASSLKWRPSRWIFVTFALASSLVVVVLVFAPIRGNYLFDTAGVSQDRRAEMLQTTLAAASEFHSIGSGLGSFAEIYRRFESPGEVTTTYANHAHNEPAELVLETGLPGVLLVIALLIWLTRQSIAIWRSRSPDPWLRAATIAAMVPLAHSLVDYPLRTAAIAGLFALCMGMIASPRPQLSKRRAETGVRHLSAG